VASRRPSAFEAETGARVNATYGAVGALRARLLEGAPCDVVVLTAAFIDALGRDRGSGSATPWWRACARMPMARRRWPS
jgi:ABC-type molybdate transport system substrate-binding protein